MQNKALDLLESVVINYLYYDRVSCEDVSAKEMERLIKQKELTVEQIVNRVKIELEKAIKENFS